MLRFGTITEIDASKCYARVKFLEDGIVSAFLQICVQGATGNKYFHIFDINEQVACLMDERSEQGVIVGALYNNGNTPSGGGSDIVKVDFNDSTSIEYNRSTHELNLNVNGTVNLIATNVNITGAAMLIGNLSVTGTVSAAAISAPVIGGGGVTLENGNLIADNEVTAGTVDLTTHVHGGVTTGSGTTAPPTP